MLLTRQTNKIERAKNLWKLYVLALSLIALFVTMVFIISEVLAHYSTDNAKVINMSGYQRTLSQRLYIFADAYLEEEDSALKQDYLDNLKSEREKFLNRHDLLLHGNENFSGLAGRVARDIFFEDPHNLDSQVRNFATLVDKLIRSDDPQEQKQYLEEIKQASLNNLLVSLDAVTARIESYDLAKKNKLVFWERLSYALAIILLLFEGLFIFRPSQRFIAEAINEKEELEKQKRDQDALAIEASDLGVWDTNLLTGETYYSERWCSMLGYEADEIEGHFSTWESLVHPDDYKTAYASFQTHLAGETEQFAIEHRLRCKDGAYKWILSRGRVSQRGEDGSPIRALGSHLDITERKNAFQRAELFLTLASNAMDSFIIADEKGRIEWVNPAFKTVTGYTLSEVAGKKPGEFLTGPDTDPKTSALIGQKLARGEAVKTEILNYSKQGRPYWISLLITPLKNNAGVIEKFISIQRDITEQKIYETNLEEKINEKTKDLQETNKRLKHEQESIAAIMNHVAEGLIVIDRSGTILNYNKGAKKIFGYESEDAIGQNVKILMFDDLAVNHDNFIDHHIQTGEKKIIDKGREVLGRRINGDSVPIALSITRLELDNELFFIGTTRDITVEKEKQASLEQALYDAEQANRAKDDFLANMSHELRTPLNSIMGLTNILMGRDYAQTDMKSLETISNASSSLLKIVNDILDLSKIEAGKVTLEKENFNVRDFVTNVAAHAQPIAAKQGLAFRGNYNNVPSAIYCADHYRIERILLNILSNAIKYTETGHVQFDCSLQPSDDGALMQVEITDTGIGIPAEKLDEVFEKFTQSDQSIERRYGGTGLGLSITKHLVDLMGGELRVESKETKGTKFTVTIPLSPASEIDKAQTGDHPITKERDAIPDLKSLQEASVLVAEDNEFNIVFIEELLKNLQCYNFTVAMDGEECVEAMQNGDYDLVLMDCHMPKMNGFDAAAKIREFDETTPIIAITADLKLETKLRCEQVGINDYLDKPINEAAFVRMLSTYLSMQGVQNDNQNQSVEFDVEDKPFNLDLLMEYVKGDEDRLKRLIGVFIDKTGEDLKTMQTLHDNDDHENWCKMAHKMKGSAAYIQAPVLEGLCEQGQDLEKEDERAILFDQIKQAHTDVCAFMEQQRLNS